LSDFDDNDLRPRNAHHRRITRSRSPSLIHSCLDDDTNNSPQSPSRTPSPAPGDKRSHEDIEEDSEVEVDIDAGLAKAQKINNHSGRPKASDYDDISREVILRATSHYRVLISTCEAFPDSATEIRMVKEAWTSANTDSCLPPIAISPDISKIVSQ
jgi:hypothetical protein